MAHQGEDLALSLLWLGQVGYLALKLMCAKAKTHTHTRTHTRTHSHAPPVLKKILQHTNAK